jgi:hypothetical protein
MKNTFFNVWGGASPWLNKARQIVQLLQLCAVRLGQNFIMISTIIMSVYKIQTQNIMGLVLRNGLVDTE